MPSVIKNKPLTRAIISEVFLSLIILCLFFIHGCYYDSKEYLYPQTACKDTVAPITYSGKIQPIISEYCLGCHSGANPDGNVQLGSYNDVKAQIENKNQLRHSIIQDGTVTPMPRNGGKLDDCKIQAFTIWINNGYLNN